MEKQDSKTQMETGESWSPNVCAVVASELDFFVAQHTNSYFVKNAILYRLQISSPNL